MKNRERENWLIEQKIFKSSAWFCLTTDRLPVSLNNNKRMRPLLCRMWRSRSPVPWCPRSIPTTSAGRGHQTGQTSAPSRSTWDTRSSSRQSLWSPLSAAREMGKRKRNRNVWANRWNCLIFLLFWNFASLQFRLLNARFHRLYLVHWRELRMQLFQPCEQIAFLFHLILANMQRFVELWMENHRKNRQRKLREIKFDSIEKIEKQFCHALMRCKVNFASSQ